MEKSLVLLIHGIGGSGEGTWANFPKLLRNDSELGPRFDVHFYEYPSGLSRIPFGKKMPKIQDLARGLATEIRNRYGTYGQVALICHSLGGLVARQYVAEALKGGRSIPVQRLMLISSPSTGAQLASIGRLLSWNHDHLEQLAEHSDFLESLNDDWRELDIEQKIGVRYVVAGLDKVVNRESARNNAKGSDLEVIIDKGHIDIVKATTPNDLIFQVAKRFLLEGSTVEPSRGESSLIKLPLSHSKESRRTNIGGMNAERIVCVEAYFQGMGPGNGDSRRLGTGFRVGPGLVLTSQNVVERPHGQGPIERAHDIWVFLSQKGTSKMMRRRAKVIWPDEAALDHTDSGPLDVALLEDELPRDGFDLFSNFVLVPLGRSGHWRASGFVSASTGSAEIVMANLWGACDKVEGLSSFLKLMVNKCELFNGEVKSPTWESVSGAPVFISEGRYQGYIYGIIRSRTLGPPEALEAVSMPVLLRNAKLRLLIGIKTPVPPHVSLVEQLRSFLEEDSQLAGQLAGLDQSSESRWRKHGTDELVDMICNEWSLKSTLEKIRHLYKELDPSSLTVERVRHLALVLVSILASREVPGGEVLTAESTRRIHLGTASPNFAEALLAAAYGKPCRFVKADASDLPRAFLRVPSAVMEAGIRAKRLIAEQIEELVFLLLEKDLDQPRFVRKTHKAIFSTEDSRAQREFLQMVVDRSLKRLEERHGRPHYLVLERGLQEKMGAHLDSFLVRLTRVLPSLQLVVLESDSEKIGQAIEQEDSLWPLWEILEMSPEE